MISGVFTNPLPWLFGMIWFAMIMYDCTLHDRREIARLMTELREAEADLNRLIDVLDEIAELPNPGRARDLARDELGLPYSEWPKAVAA